MTIPTLWVDVSYAQHNLLRGADMPKNDDALTAAEIAAVIGCERYQITRWKAELGEPVNPGDRRPRWPRERALALGKAHGYLDARGRKIKEAPATGIGRTPLPHVPDGKSETYYFVPDIAAMFGVERVAVHAWVNRGHLPDPKDEHSDVIKVGRYYAWPLSTLRAFARSTGRTMDKRAARK